MLMEESQIIKEILNDIITKVLKEKKNKKNKKKRKNRCAFEGCNKKVLSIYIKCKCDKSFCGKHRSLDSHKCPTLKKEFNKEDFCRKCGLGGGVYNKLERI